MWYLFQAAIFTAVMFVAIAYGWFDIVGPGSYAPAAIAAFAAWLATVIVSKLVLALRANKRQDSA